jgi:hypothetical protein
VLPRDQRPLSATRYTNFFDLSLFGGARPVDLGAVLSAAAAAWAACSSRFGILRIVQLFKLAGGRHMETLMKPVAPFRAYSFVGSTVGGCPGRLSCPVSVNTWRHCARQVVSEILDRRERIRSPPDASFVYNGSVSFPFLFFVVAVLQGNLPRLGGLYRALRELKTATDSRSTRKKAAPTRRLRRLCVSHSHFLSHFRFSWLLSCRVMYRALVDFIVL